MSMQILSHHILYHVHACTVIRCAHTHSVTGLPSMVLGCGEYYCGHHPRPCTHSKVFSEWLLHAVQLFTRRHCLCESADSTLMCAVISSKSQVASYPGHTEKRPGIDCLRMHEKPHDSWGIGFLRVLSAICTTHSHLPKL